MFISNYIAIGCGGALGAMVRVALSKVLPYTIAGIPFSIMSVNLLGCFLIGLLTELMALHFSFTENLRYFLVSGFLGGFTTFSTFALEFGLLVEKNEYQSAILYSLISVVGSIVLFFAGLKLVRLF